MENMPPISHMFDHYSHKVILVMQGLNIYTYDHIYILYTLNLDRKVNYL